MYNRRYDKVFLMLRQETAGYSLGQRAPWGSCVMEIKNGMGRITLTVQSLRPIHRGKYAVYAIAGEGEMQKNFFCGVLKPDTAGHCELKWDFNPDNLEGKGVVVENLNTVAILAEADGGFSVPLTAYFGSKVEWRTYFKKNTSKISVQKEVIKKVEIPAVETTQEVTLVAAEAPALDKASFEFPKINWKKDEEKEEKRKPIETKAENYHGSFRGLLEKFRQELEELQDTGVFTEKDMERIERAGRRNLQNGVVTETIDLKSAEEIMADGNEEMEETEMVVPEDTMENQEQQEEEIQTESMSIPEEYVMLKENKEIFPFEDEDLPWKLITLEETMLLEGIPLSWLKDYFFLMPMRKYHHFIWKPEAEGYSIGIPGTDSSDNQQRAQELGFGEFRKMKNDDLGYWVMTKK
ncbi:hypothetical protein [Anaerotignum sp.]|uniref:DUF7922 domain-containing protein n=1 Tax=Anaerotignum sp. TaxID=2039241 RepID=UPI003321F3B3